MEIVGDYEYNSKDLIGHGAFAVVYKGRKRKNHQEIVAIKSITKKNLAKSQHLLGKEINILKELTKLHHENVVALLDCKESANNFFLVMEYCNGGDLADYLSVKGTLSEETIRMFLCQLAGAMKALYVKGVIHRDLKPQNILLSHNSSQPLPQPHEIKLKIADFGFARFLQDGVMAATLCGSPMYMAPEVIMSLQYDAKADLWSLGTIVFQCLTGKAPFQANTPQALKQFYERNSNLNPKIPSGTSPELTNLLTGLLRRNSRDRISFHTFFNHPFIRRNEQNQKEINNMKSNDVFNNLTNGSPILGNRNTPPSSPVVKKTSSRPDSPILTSRENRSGSSPEITDDYVIVPSNLPTDPLASNEILNISYDNLSRKNSSQQQQLQNLRHNSNVQNNGAMMGATRPGTLSMSKPIPVPTMREAFVRMCSKDGSNIPPSDNFKDDNSKTNNNSAIPRSQPITMKRSDRNSIHPDISSLSPPSVQFTLGTPPGGFYGSGRRRSTSSSLSETPPPPNVWQVSPITGAPRQTPNGSPLRRSGSCTNSPIVTPIIANQIINQMGSPPDNNNIRHSPMPIPVSPFSTRAMTLPDISEAGGIETNRPYDLSSFSNEQPFLFHPPELSEETLLEKEHNEVLAKLNFVLALTECILKLAVQRVSPLILDDNNQAAACSSIMSETNNSTAVAALDSNTIKKSEQMVLLVRALQLLGNGLHLANEQLQSGQLRPSNTVRNVVNQLNKKFRSTLIECKKLNEKNLLLRAEQANITADKLLYNHAIKMCQSAALDELFGSPQQCFQRYQTAQLLLHSLASKITNQHDKNILCKYKEAVEKRLYILHQHGIVYANEQI